MSFEPDLPIVTRSSEPVNEGLGDAEAEDEVQHIPPSNNDERVNVPSPHHFADECAIVAVAIIILVPIILDFLTLLIGLTFLLLSLVMYILIVAFVLLIILSFTFLACYGFMLRYAFHILRPWLWDSVDPAFAQIIHELLPFPDVKI